jgi:diacylglycerol kinase
MKNNQPLKSIGFAVNGLALAFRSEVNIKIHLLATTVVIVLSCCLNISTLESIALALCISMVWCAELFNTAIEKTIDYVSTDVDPKIKFIKDVSAAAVLVTAIAALIIGLFIFIPKLF